MTTHNSFREAGMERGERQIAGTQIKYSALPFTLGAFNRRRGREVAFNVAFALD